MKITMTATHPENVEITLTATMNLGDWQEITARLKNASRGQNYHHGTHEFINKINDTVQAATRTFWPEKPMEEAEE